MPELNQHIGPVLESVGLSIHAGQINLDLPRARSAYIHHSCMPVAVVGYAQVSTVFAKERFPKTTFIDVIQKRPAMDEDEVCALAALCGVAVQPPFWGNPEPFGKLLWELIGRFALEPFFERVDRPYTAGDHGVMRPRGFDWSDPEQPELPGALAAWRAAYRKLPLARQLWVTTILQLYKQGHDPYWMVRVPKSWHAADAIATLREHGSLADWARLCALYPGW